MHRVVVEVRDPGVDPQDGLCDGELVLPRPQLVVHEGGGQFRLSDVARRDGDLRLALLGLRLPGAGADGVDMGPQLRCRGLDRGEVGTGEGERGARGLGGEGAVVAGVGAGQGLLAEVAAVRGHRDGDPLAVLALGGLAHPAVGDEVGAVRGTAALDEDVARREVALRAAVGEGAEGVRVREAAQNGQFGELPGITRTVAPEAERRRGGEAWTSDRTDHGDPSALRKPAAGTAVSVRVTAGLPRSSDNRPDAVYRSVHDITPSSPREPRSAGGPPAVRMPCRAWSEPPLGTGRER